MNKKQLFIKLVILVVGVVSVFLLSSCFTSLRLLSCKKSCMESCNSSSDDNISGHDYGIYYSLSNDGEYYWVEEVWYKETSVIIPETYEGLPVMKIRNGAFTHYRHSSGCGGSSSLGMSLLSLTLPKTIVAIEGGVFAGYYEHYRAVDPYFSEGARCEKLVFEGTLEDWCNIEFGSSPFTGVAELYIDDEKVVDLVIPESVTEIKENTFTYYAGLKSVTLHENITEIKEYAFYCCKGIGSVTFPCTDLIIGECAFSNCWGLTAVTFTGENLVLCDGAFASCMELKDVEWNAVNITVIPAGAFSCCSGLEVFVIPSSVEAIGSGAFDDCYGLSEVYNLSKLNVVAGSYANGGVAYYAGAVYTEEGAESIILSVGDYKFVVSEEKTTLFKYTGESGVLNLPDLDGGYTIRENAFFENSKITAVYIPKCVTEIGERAFALCDNLQLVTGCVGIKIVDGGAFNGCGRLEKVELPNVEEIRGEAFYNCTAIKLIELPKTLTFVGRVAFWNCTAEITYDGTLEDWSKVVWDGVTSDPGVTIICSDGEWTGNIQDSE